MDPGREEEAAGDLPIEKTTPTPTPNDEVKVVQEGGGDVKDVEAPSPPVETTTAAPAAEAAEVAPEKQQESQPNAREQDYRPKETVEEEKKDQEPEVQVGEPDLVKKEVSPSNVNVDIDVDVEDHHTNEAKEESKGESTPPPSLFQKYKKVFGGVLILVLIAIVAVLVVVLGQSNDDSNKQASSSSSSANAGIGAGAGDDSTDQPTFVPTLAPTSPPTVFTPTPRPTRRPTAVPTESPSTSPPTRRPTGVPTRTPTTLSPTQLPTRRPTPVPTINFEEPLSTYLNTTFQIDMTADETAKQILRVMLAEPIADGGDGSLDLTPKLAQRFTLLKMDLILFGSRQPSLGNFFDPTNDPDRKLQVYSRWGAFGQDECAWRGVTCNANQEVTDIQVGQQDLSGTIPTEIGLLSALTLLNIADNQLQGSLPEELYNCVNLQKIFLYRNQLTGTISEKIENLWGLTHFNLAVNQLTGPIPPTMRSDSRGIFRIQTFSVYDNQMTGTIPEDLKLRQMKTFDLGRNRFSGTLPALLGFEWVRLLHLYFDHNRFTGRVPEEIVNAGNGKLLSLALNDNQFTGALPGNHLFITEMNEFTVQNNRFSSMGERTCMLNVLQTGELAEFKSDCNICICGNNNQMCRNCYN